MPRGAAKAVNALAAYLVSDLSTYIDNVNSEESLTGGPYELSNPREILKHRTGNEHRDSTFYVFDVGGARDHARTGHSVVDCAVVFVLQSSNKKPADAEIKARYMLDALVRCLDADGTLGSADVAAYVTGFDFGMGSVGEGTALVVGYSVEVDVHTFDE